MVERPTDSPLSSVIQTMSSPQGKPPRGPSMPVALAVPVVLLAVAFGAWFLYRYAIRGTMSPVAEVVQLDGPSIQTTAGLGSVSRQRGAVHARGPDYYLRATRRGDNSYSIGFDFSPEARRSWVTPEQWELHEIAQRAISIPKFARHIKLSDEQRKQLQAVSIDIKLTAAEVQKLQPHLVGWDRATDRVLQRSAQEPLLEATQAIAAARRADARAAQLRRVQEIPKILTAEQRQLAENYIRPAGATPSP